MQRLEKYAKPPRFERVHLKGWGKSDLIALSGSAEFANTREKITTFRRAHGVTGVLYPSEKRLVAELIEDVQESSITSLRDVHGYYLNQGTCYFSEKGLLVETPQQELVKKDIWLVPDELKSQKPAIQNIVGVSLAVLESDSVATLTTKADMSTLTTLKYHHLDVPGLVSVTDIFRDYLVEPFSGPGKLEGGRHLVDRMYDAVASLSNEDYLVMHYMLCAGPFNDHFKWARVTRVPVKNSQGQRVMEKRTEELITRTPGYVPGDIILDVKEQYKANYTDYSSTVTGKKMIADGLEGKIFMWTKGHEIKFKIPLSTEVTFPVAHKFMSDCRTFRGTDDKSLSGWSSGFGSTGNPTKIQSRIQRKLSVIMGAMLMDKKGSVVVEDALINELPVLAQQITEWKERRKDIHFRPLSLVCPSGKSRVFDLLGKYTDIPVDMTDSTIIIFPELDTKTSKNSEWASTNLSCVTFRDRYFPNTIDYTKPFQHKIVMCHLFSEVYFQHAYVKPYVFGSVHNMIGYLSNDGMLCALSNGTGPWHLDVQRQTSPTKMSFLKSVCDHNGYRTGFFMGGTYFFNTKMNLLRHIPGKTINFEESFINDVDSINVEEEISRSTAWMEPKKSVSDVIQYEEMPEDEPAEDDDAYWYGDEADGNESAGSPDSDEDDKAQKEENKRLEAEYTKVYKAAVQRVNAKGYIPSLAEVEWKRGGYQGKVPKANPQTPVVGVKVEIKKEEGPPKVVKSLLKTKKAEEVKKDEPAEEDSNFNPDF